MNRLWVWVSLVILGVVLIVTFFPFAYRSVVWQSEFSADISERIPPEERNPDEFRIMMERRFWTNISRTLIVGAAVGLVAGVLLTRWLVAPLRRLERGAEAVAERRLDYRVSEEGTKEMRSLAKSFNSMVEELENQETLRKNMLADVTHELRHPIHVISGSLQAILDGVYALDMDEVERLSKQTKNLTALVDDLYELAQAEAQELHLNLQEINLVECVIDTLSIYKPMASHKTINIIESYPTTEVRAIIDSQRMRQALQNLIINGLFYTPEGGEVEITLSESKKEIAIKVTDNGIGITPDNLSRVFDRFYRQDSSRNRDFPGTGLGLAITKAIVQAHGGQIEAYSSGINRGATFRIKLPRDISCGDL